MSLTRRDLLRSGVALSATTLVPASVQRAHALLARYANAAAAISVTRHGGSSAPTNCQVQTFLSQVDGPSTGARGQTKKADQTA